MAVHFHQLKVKEVKKETEDCVSITLDVPQELQEIFEYREGQNITVKHEEAGEEIRRSYSICAAPYEKKIKVAVKKVTGGKFSSFANDVLQAGQELMVMPPTGKFNVKQQAGNFLVIAAGSGITPVLSIIKHILQTQPQSHATLLYGNKNRQSIIFFEELEGLKNIYMERFACHYILSRERTDVPLNYGRLGTEKLEAFSPLIKFKEITEAFICGPEEMIFSSAAFLEKTGMEKENIHFELFTTPGVLQKTKQAEVIEEDDAPKSKITIKLDGRSLDIFLGYKGSSILDAALQQGADLPFACKGGVCCTCRAKLVKGEVHMDVNYALEKEEVEAGFILTCQSHPLTEEVVIDFDVK